MVCVGCVDGLPALFSAFRSLACRMLSLGSAPLGLDACLACLFAAYMLRHLRYLPFTKSRGRHTAACWFHAGRPCPRPSNDLMVVSSGNMLRVSRSKKYQLLSLSQDQRRLGRTTEECSPRKNAPNIEEKRIVHPDLLLPLGRHAPRFPVFTPPSRMNRAGRSRTRCSSRGASSGCMRRSGRGWSRRLSRPGPGVLSWRRRVDRCVRSLTTRRSGTSLRTIFRPLPDS